MHILEEGVLETSQIYFLIPSNFAKETLYCLQHLGVFFCDQRYVVTHPYWESVLILFVDEGTLEVSFDEQHYEANEGDIVIIDCRHQHKYRAKDHLKFRYFHFTGKGSEEYINLLYKLNGSTIFRNSHSAMLNNAFRSLLRLAQSQSSMQNEHRISVYIHMILCELVEKCSNIPSVTNEYVDKAICYMEEHVTQNISLDEIASHIKLSKFYFSRYFKKYMGMTPHQYFINMRVQYAKQLLVTTYASVEEVADQCGFDNASNFIRTFKHRTGMTPTTFRSMPF